MCLTCGCGDPFDNHGNADYLVFDDLTKSAALEKQSAADALRILNETIKKVPAAEMSSTRG